MHDYHVERHTERRRQTVQDHADAVADQNHVAMDIDQLRHRRSISRQTDERGTSLGSHHLRWRYGRSLSCNTQFCSSLNLNLKNSGVTGFRYKWEECPTGAKPPKRW